LSHKKGTSLKFTQAIVTLKIAANYALFCHSRAGGNPVSHESLRGIVFLDSRLRGNDA
jgi:hypothetical protein